MRETRGIKKSYIAGNGEDWGPWNLLAGVLRGIRYVRHGDICCVEILLRVIILRDIGASIRHKSSR